MSAAEALRNARILFDCADTRMIDARCWQVYIEVYEGPDRETRHRTAASALLDGMSVRAVTEAGG